ncbi:SDR family NAD(P)-dependent oxidoreductase, partial [Streptomyces sp. 2MCAF27]
RDARTDLTGRRALLTGGRAKIGMYIALRLLRDGAHTTITTRFPNDAIRRFKAMPDSGEWLHRLKIVGIDLRDPAQVVALADSVRAAGPLDILINNAAQTVRRTPAAYAELIAGESAALPAGELPDSAVLGAFGSGAQAALPGPAAARDGAHTTITTRFPNDAIRRFKAMPDSGEWLHRLKIVGIDLRDPAQVVALADS